MLTYTRINLLSMISSFTPDEAVRVATDSIYVRKSALKRLESVKAFMPMKKCDGGGSGKNTPAIELFRQRDPLVFIPIHRLAKEMRARGVQAQTYHSFFRWSDQTE